MSLPIPQLILGTANFGPDLPSTPWHTHNTLEAVTTLLDTWRSLGGVRIDTAALYGKTKEYGPHGSEKRLQEAGATATDSGFVIDTKILVDGGGSHQPRKIRESLEGSLKALGASKVNLYYLHVPDRETPYLDSLKELAKLKEEGKFAHYGISNYTAKEVKEILELAEQHHLPKPETYQGNYNALCRGGEDELFPLLRQHGISFYAYSPLAMGMLAGGPEKESLEAARGLPKGSRFHPDSRKAGEFQDMWFKPALFDAVKILNQTSRESGIPPIELSLRWIAYHSQLSPDHGDAIILGASSPQQLEDTVKAIRAGPLEEEVAAAFEKIWDTAKSDAPAYHF